MGRYIYSGSHIVVLTLVKRSRMASPPDGFYSFCRRISGGRAYMTFEAYLSLLPQCRIP
ncbi:hypothetical protein RchiOBHm_Chr4g0385831 [Rosa chinensis]|uniref:Uncharacterized protein n=1 Tax=Rosa chinensis TaxID=74649 RepID=A0A2P6QP20_ROSCH|nr:hypothetical protein RchiOBHm_Chr4g0385831 [Rosa chinensis]